MKPFAKRFGLLTLLKKELNLLTYADEASAAGPSSTFSPLNFAKLFCSTHGLCILMKGPAAGLQMAVCIDKTILLPRPGNITQTLSPLPTKIHLFLCGRLEDPSSRRLHWNIDNDDRPRWISEQHHARFNWQVLSRDRFAQMNPSADVIISVKVGGEDLYKAGAAQSTFVLSVDGKTIYLSFKFMIGSLTLHHFRSLFLSLVHFTANLSSTLHIKCLSLLSVSPAFL